MRMILMIRGIIRMINCAEGSHPINYWEMSMVEAMRPVYKIVYVYICFLRFYEYIIIGLEGAEGLYEGSLPAGWLDLPWNPVGLHWPEQRAWQE